MPPTIFGFLWGTFITTASLLIALKSGVLSGTDAPLLLWGAVGASGFTLTANIIRCMD